MAVYARTYKGYTGPLTPRLGRSRVLLRYGYARLFSSKFVVLAVALSMAYPLGCIAWIYVSHNPLFLAMADQQPGGILKIDGRFFYYFSVVQGAAAYLLTALVGPGLVAPDFANGALPLYFCRPISRAQYILGKLGILMILLSIVTWIPGMVLFAVQASLAETGWTGTNAWLAGAIFLGLGTWSVLLSLIALAVSAWVKWRIAAGATILGMFFAGAGFGVAINNVMRTSHGSLIDLSQMMHVVWSHMFRYDPEFDVPLANAWAVLGAAAAICLILLNRRIRAFEVTK